MMPGNFFPKWLRTESSEHQSCQDPRISEPDHHRERPKQERIPQQSLKINQEQRMAMVIALLRGNVIRFIAKAMPNRKVQENKTPS
jgi:hypothetical protein